MKYVKSTALSLIAVLFLAGCSNMTTSEKRVLGGTALGAAGGAALGSISGHAGTGALIGAGVGAVGGALYDADQRSSYRHHRYYH